MAVERLLEPYAGVGTGHNPAHRVATGRPGSQANPCDGVQHRRDVAGLDVVQLNLLARGDVSPPLAVLVDQLRQPARGLRLDGAAGATADHEDVGLCLRAHSVSLQSVAFLRSQPVVPLGAQTAEVDGQAGSLRSRDVGRAH